MWLALGIVVSHSKWFSSAKFAALENSLGAPLKFVSPVGEEFPDWPADGDEAAHCIYHTI